MNNLLLKSHCQLKRISKTWLMEVWLIHLLFHLWPIDWFKFCITFTLYSFEPWITSIGYYCVTWTLALETLLSRWSRYYSHDSKLTLLVPTTTGIVHRVRLQLDPSYPLKLYLDGLTIELLEIQHLLVQFQKFRRPARHFLGPVTMRILKCLNLSFRMISSEHLVAWYKIVWCNTSHKLKFIYAMTLGCPNPNLEIFNSLCAVPMVWNYLMRLQGFLWVWHVARKN